GVRGRDLRRLGQLVELRVPRRDPVPGRGREHLDLPASPQGAAMSEGAATMSDNGTPALEVRSASKYFGSVNALEDISLAVYPGQVTCVLGDNGAGKSTLIKILSGVYAPDRGEMFFEGEPVSFTGPREARARGIA